MAGTFGDVRKLTVVLVARLAEPVPALCEEGLAVLFGDATDALMAALIDLGAEDPFVFADAGAPALRVEVVAEGDTEPEALSAGVGVIAGAFGRAADALDVLGVGSVSAHTVDLVSA
jgi:hypothetical protein